MARDSRLWQNSLAHAKVFEGDQNECDKWYAWAQQKLRFMLANHPGATTQVFAPIDSVTVRVDTRPNRIYIKAGEGGIYMESGFIDFVSTGKCTEAAYRPGTLNYNAKVSAELNSVTPIQGKVKLKATDLPESPFAGELLTDGQESLSVGCKESTRLPSITTPPPCDATFTNGGYCGLDLWARKTTMQKVPASLYSGKLRLFVQAMYGSTRDDLSYEGSKLVLTDQSGAVYANPTDGRIKLAHSGISSHWLYTIGEGGYALCYFNGAYITMIPLLLSKIATKFAETLAAHPNKNDFSFHTKVEAYILAYAKPEYDSTLWIRFPVANPVIYGEPLSYGWHPNWKGDEANVVNFYASPDTGDRFISNQYKLVIEQTLVDKSFVFSAELVTVQANKEWSNWTTLIYPFYYDDQSLQMMALAKPGILPPADFNFDSPIYCFTKLNTVSGDCELNVVNVYNQKDPVSSYNNYNGVWPASHSTFHYEDQKTYASVGAKKGQTGVKVAGGANSITLLGDYEDSHSSLYEEWVHNGSVYWASQKAGTATYGYPSSWWLSFGFADVGLGVAYLVYSSSTATAAFVEWEIGQYYRHGIENTGSSKATKAIIEVPHYSCDCVIVGIEERSAQTSYSQERSSSQVGLVHRDSRLNRAEFDGSGWVRTGDILATASVGHLAPTDSGIGGTDAMALVNPPYDTISNVIPSGTFRYNTTVKESVGSEPVATVINTNVTISGSDPYPNDERYFAPSLSDPGTGTVDVVQTSIQSGAKSSHTLYSSDYGFIKNASVGWA
jgi:hypothetical protein